MRVALTGFPEAGLAQLHAAICGAGEAPAGSAKLTTIKIPDPRVDALAEIWNPRKKVYREVQFTLLEQPAAATAADAWLQALAACEAVAHLVDGRESLDADATKAIDAFNTDCVLRDLGIVERRLERMAKQNVKGLERDLLVTLQRHLEEGAPLRRLSLDGQQQAALPGFGFVSSLPLLEVVNVDEGQLASPLPARALEAAASSGAVALPLSAALEAEIARLDEADQRAFLDDLGIAEPARGRFLRAASELLDLITFLTMGEDECRSWGVRRGALAPEAGRRIHTDIERGFIRVEVIRFEDFTALRSEAACRKVGKLRVEGKDYTVADGDILNFRFNV